jgi:GDP-L-fucose synthase
MIDLTGKRIWVAGHRGMVGSALVRRLQQENCVILTADRKEVDLFDKSIVDAWIDRARPDAIFLAAAKVGGILANDRRPVDFLLENLAIQTNVISAAHQFDIDHLCFLGSSCIYPKFAEQPIVEAALLSGILEQTNESYAIAKIAGIKLVEAYRRQYGRNYISVMPTNLYGPNDNFELDSSHVLPALLRKAHESKNHHRKSITIWGSGKPRREFLHVDDCADACVFLLKTYSDAQHINIGSGADISIIELAQLVCDVVGYDGLIETDVSMPDGTPRKLMSNAKLKALGWAPSIDLRSGIAMVYDWYLTQNQIKNSEERFED